MRELRNRSDLLEMFDSAPSEVQWYLSDLPELLQYFGLDVTLAYLFSKVELAHNMALYCGIAKLHKVDTGLAQTAIANYHLTRRDLREKLKLVYGKPLPKAAIAELEEAEKVRDLVMHGKRTSDPDLRRAIGAVLCYAATFNDHIYGCASLRPFGRLRGFKGRGKSLPKPTSRWVLRGMGFSV